MRRGRLGAIESQRRPARACGSTARCPDRAIEKEPPGQHGPAEIRDEGDRWDVRHDAVVLARRPEQDRTPITDIGAAAVIFVWRTPPGPEGALLDLVVRSYRPILWIVFGAALVVALSPLLAWAFKRMRG
jgi:hypothetical protein